MENGWYEARGDRSVLRNAFNHDMAARFAAELGTDGRHRRREDRRPLYMRFPTVIHEEDELLDL